MFSKSLLTTLFLQLFSFPVVHESDSVSDSPKQTKHEQMSLQKTENDRLTVFHFFLSQKVLPAAFICIQCRFCNFYFQRKAVDYLWTITVKPFLLFLMKVKVLSPQQKNMKGFTNI